MAPEPIPAYKPKGDRPPQADRAPKGKAPTGGTKKLATDRPFKHTIPQIREALQGGLAATVLALSTKAAMTQDEVAERDADLLAENGEELINSWIWLAEKNPSVRRMLEYLCGGGGYFTFAMANLTIVLGLAQNHGVYPAEWPTPSSLKLMMGNMFASNGESSTSSHN